LASREVADDQAVFQTDIPTRLDRLGWSRFHTRVIAALGITLLLYLVSTVLSACSVDFWSVALFRMLTGAGVELWIGLKSEGQSLEDIARPLAGVD